MSNVSRGSGGSAVAADSYITGVTIRDARTGEEYNYGRAQRVLDHGTVLAEGMPEEWADSGGLSNAIEEADKPKDSKTAKKIEIALPVELSLDQQRELLLSYIQKEITDHGYGCVWAIHSDARGNNPHAHILIANRPFSKGKWQPKQKSSYALDENGDRIPIIDRRTGKQKLGARNAKLWVREKVDHYIDRKDTLLHLREAWAQFVNQALERSGSDERIDHRSYEDQESEMIPTKHEGYAQRRREEEDPNYISPIMDENRRIRAHNELTQRRIYERVAAQVRTWFAELLQTINKKIRAGSADPSRRRDGTILERIHGWFARLSGRSGKKDRRGATGERESAQAATDRAVRISRAATTDGATERGNSDDTRRAAQTTGRILAHCTDGVRLDGRIADLYARSVSSDRSTDAFNRALDNVDDDTLDLINDTVDHWNIHAFAMRHGIYIDPVLGRTLGPFSLRTYSSSPHVQLYNRITVAALQGEDDIMDGLNIVDFAHAFIPEYMEQSYTDTAINLIQEIIPARAPEIISQILDPAARRDRQQQRTRDAQDIRSHEDDERINQTQQVQRTKQRSTGWER